MFKRIDHVEIIPHCLERSLDFYTKVLGFRIRERRRIEMPPVEEVVYLELGDTVVEFMSVKGSVPASRGEWGVGYRALALEVEEMDEAIEYLEGRGVEITWGPVTLGKAKRAEIRDPDGLPIELRQW